MPTYAYACTECGHRFDAVQSFSDATLSVCPECSGPLRKEYGSIGVTFTGSGFYRTDSRGKKESTGAASASGGDSAGSGTKSKAEAPASTASSAS